MQHKILELEGNLWIIEVINTLHNEDMKLRGLK